MGAGVPPVHRVFSTRHSFARAVIVTFTVLFIFAVTFRSDPASVRSVILKTAQSAKEKIVSSYHTTEKDGFVPEQPPEEAKPITEGERGSTLTASYYNNSHHSPGNCNGDVEHLSQLKAKYSLQGNFEYLKRYVRILRQDIDRKSVTKLTQTLLEGDFKKFDVSNSSVQDTCPEPLVIPVSKSPYPASADASSFMFGVSTTYARFADANTSPVDDWTYWLTDGKGQSNGGKLILMLLGASDDELMGVSEHLSQVGIDADVLHSDPSLEMGVRYLALVPTMYHHPHRQGKKWLVNCDDDTFFPAMHGLIRRLEEFDTSQPLYVGTLSEDVHAVDRHGSQAFGGAGVFLSMPLAEAISEEFEICRSEERIQSANTGWGVQGDILLRNCIYDQTDVKLTVLRDLWQLDIFGDPSGFYESGIKPLSLHHYRGSWHVAYPFQFTKLAHLCGEDCTLQRFQTADDFVISAGFSIAQYPHGIDVDLNQVERTFSPATEDKGWNLDFTFGPQRPSLHQTGRKWSWDMQESTLNEDGSVTQTYVRKHDDWRWKTADGAAMSDQDGVIELVWVS